MVLSARHADRPRRVYVVNQTTRSAMLLKRRARGIRDRRGCVHANEWPLRFSFHSFARTRAPPRRHVFTILTSSKKVAPTRGARLSGLHAASSGRGQGEAIDGARHRDRRRRQHRERAVREGILTDELGEACRGAARAAAPLAAHRQWHRYGRIRYPTDSQIAAHTAPGPSGKVCKARYRRRARSIWIRARLS